MSNTYHNYQTVTMVAIGVAVLLLMAGCKKNAATVHNSHLLPGLSQPVRVSSGDADAAEPAIAAAPDGSVYVVWVDHGAKTQADVMVARFNSDGRMEGSPVRVNPQPGVATAWRGDPPTVAVAADQTVFIGWTARVESESGHATDVYLSSSKDHAQTFGAPVKVNDDAKPAVHGMHSLAIGNDGQIYMAWLDERNINPAEMKDPKMDSSMKGHHMESNRELFFAASTDGGRTFTANQRVATDACPCCKTALAVDSASRVYISWRQVLPGDLRHIAIASTTDQGKTFSNPKIVSDDQWMIAGCPVSGPSISVGPGGELRVLWFSAGKNGQTGLYWSVSTNHGASFSMRSLVAGGEIQGTPVLTSYANRAGAVWAGNQPNSGKIFSAGLLTTTETPVDEFVVADGTLPAATQTSTHLAVAFVTKGKDHQEIKITSAPIK